MKERAFRVATTSGFVKLAASLRRVIVFVYTECLIELPAPRSRSLVFVVSV